MTLRGDTGYSYIGRCNGCHAVQAAMVDCDVTKKEQGREFKEWIKRGMYIERVPHEFIREHGFDDCKCDEIAAEKAAQEKSAKDALQPSLF